MNRNCETFHAVAVFLALLLLACSGVASAETADYSEHLKMTQRHMSCIRQGVAPKFEAVTSASAAPLLMRARMIFKPGEAEPTIEWLWNGDPPAAADLENWLRGWRMPCLLTDEDPQGVVEELWLTPADGQMEVGEAVPSVAPGAATVCYQSPNKQIPMQNVPQVYSAALAFFRFPADGEAPEVQIAHSVGERQFADAVRRHVGLYTPCPEGKGRRGVWASQLFISRPERARPALAPLGLVDFLGMVKGATTLHAHFDTNTMGCPFTLGWTLYQPTHRNAMNSGGPTNPNRAAFVYWLAGLQVDLPEQTEARLFGESSTIDVPCMVLKRAPPR